MTKTTDIKRVKLFGQVGYVVRIISGNEVVGVVGTYETKAAAEAAAAAVL